MDRRETMPMLGSSYYMQRPMPEFNGQQGIGQLSSSMAPFQPDVGAQSSGPELFHGPMSSIPTEANAGGGSSAGQPSGIPIRKKRGRPRKYGHGAAVSYPHPASSPTVRELNTNPTTDTAPPSKRGRGRPPGTGRKQRQDVSDHGGNWMPSVTGAGFTPHVIAIAAGEDIVEKLLTFSRQGRRSVCLMAVSGTVSSVTLIQISSGATVTYEGRFDILHMSGSFLPRATDDHVNRTEGLTISLTSPDGRVFGGVVTGVLLAASPVQVILGSFVSGGPSKTKQKAAKRRDEAALAEEETEHHSPETANPQQSQSPSSSSMGGAWPSPHAMEMQNSHFDIDLMHG